MRELQSRHYPIREDMGFQRTSWVAERVGWIVLTLLLLAALAAAEPLVSSGLQSLERWTAASARRLWVTPAAVCLFRPLLYAVGLLLFLAFDDRDAKFIYFQF